MNRIRFDGHSSGFDFYIRKLNSLFSVFSRIGEEEY